LSGSDLSGVDLSKAKLSGVDLSGADLSKANLSGVDLSKTKLSKAKLDRSQEKDLVEAFGIEWIEPKCVELLGRK
jgi:uncharacterized protein YjbI with pentapeptide repeats